MKRWVFRLLVIIGVILLVRYLMEAEEGTLTSAGQRTAKLMREKGPGATEQAARGIEALGAAAEGGARTGRRLTHRVASGDGPGAALDG